MSWHSKLQKYIVLSTTEAKYIVYCIFFMIKIFYERVGLEVRKVYCILWQLGCHPSQ